MSWSSYRMCVDSSVNESQKLKSISKLTKWQWLQREREIQMEYVFSSCVSAATSWLWREIHLQACAKKDQSAACSYTLLTCQSIKCYENQNTQAKASLKNRALLCVEIRVHLRWDCWTRCRGASTIITAHKKITMNSLLLLCSDQKWHKSLFKLTTGCYILHWRSTSQQMHS